MHEVEFTELFKLWQRIKEIISHLEAETLAQKQEADSLIDNELIDDVFQDLSENETLDFVVGDGGILLAVNNNGTVYLFV